VLVVGDPAANRTVRALATRLSDLVAKVTAIWGGAQWNGRVVVYAVTDPKFVHAWFGTRAATGRRTESTDPATFDAVVGEVWTNQSDAYSGGNPAGTRMVLTPALVKSKDAGYVEQVLRHELTHVVTDRIGTGTPPVWLVEGIAEYTASRVVHGSSVDGVTSLQRRGLTSSQWRRLKQGRFSLVLPTDHGEFYRGTNDQVADAYTSAWFTCLYIADHYGERRLRELFQRAADLAGDSSPDVADARALREVLHTSHAALGKAATGYARSLRRHFV
jgi:hypothetical protein